LNFSNFKRSPPWQTSALPQLLPPKSLLQQRIMVTLLQRNFKSPSPVRGFSCFALVWFSCGLNRYRNPTAQNWKLSSYLVRWGFGGVTTRRLPISANAFPTNKSIIAISGISRYATSNFNGSRSSFLVLEPPKCQANYLGPQYTR